MSARSTGTVRARDEAHDHDASEGRRVAGYDEDEAGAASTRWAPMNARALKTEVDRSPPDAAGQGNAAMDRATSTGATDLPYRAEMEGAFGADFSSVRAHVGAAEPLAEMGAVAAARGEQVSFASASPDRAVVAHELTHVVQQRNAGNNAVAALGAIETRGSAAEREADTVAAAVARGAPAPAISAAPEAEIARVYGDFDNMPDDVLPPPPAPSPSAKGATASEWLDAFSGSIGSALPTHMAGSYAATGHPRLHWIVEPDVIGQRVAEMVSFGTASIPGTFSERLERAVAPADLEAQIDAIRPITDTSQGNRGPLDYVPEAAVIIARELERAVAASTARIGKRVVAAVDAIPDEQVSLPDDDLYRARDASIALPDAIVVSHPIDFAVAFTITDGLVAEVETRQPDEEDPLLDRMAAAGSAGLRPVLYEWVDDPALWNWIRVEPDDATPEEVAQAVLGDSARAFELRVSPPLYGLPPADVEALWPGHSQAADDRVQVALDPDELSDALHDKHAGPDESDLAASSAGDEAGLAQASRLDTSATDATAMAQRCRAQVMYLGREFPQFTAQTLLAAMAARLEARIEKLPTLPTPEYKRFAALFEAQANLLSDVATELDPLAMQAARLQKAETDRAATDPTAKPNPDVDPGIVELATEILAAGNLADLPETARARLAAAKARQQVVVYDALDSMLDDARSRTTSTMPLSGSHGPADPANGKATGTDVANDLRAREEALTGSVLQARRDQAAGTQTPDETQVLGERVRALQVESRLVSNMTHCAHMRDQLRDQLGLVAFFTLQYGDLENAANRLNWLHIRMGTVLDDWRAEHGKLFAALDAGCCQEPDPVAAARAAIDQLELELKKVGDDTVKKALEVAYDELEDIAIARIIADIALMVGLTFVTGGLGSAAAGLARGMRMGRLVVALADITTQSVAMAGLRSAIYGDSFVEAIGTELVTNFAGFAALRGLAHALPKTRFARKLATLRQGEGGLKYVAHATELTIEGATMAGVQFAIAEAESLIRQGRTLNDDELKMLAIQGIGMFLGNAVAHRLAGEHMDALSAYATKVGVRYRRKDVAKLADNVKKTGDPEQAKQMMREDRELVENELLLYQMAETNPAEALNIGEQTLATLKGQATTHLGELQGMSVEYSLQHGLDEMVPGKAWEGPPERVQPALDDAQGAGAKITTQPQPDGKSTVHTIETADGKKYVVTEWLAQKPANDPASQWVTEAQARLGELEAKPYSGVTQPAEQAHIQTFWDAETEAGLLPGSEAVLDKLDARLTDPAAKAGLAEFRTRLGDDKVLEIIKVEVHKQNLDKFLAEKKTPTPEEKQRLQAEIRAAREELSYARLAEQGVFEDTLVKTRADHEAVTLIEKLARDGKTDQKEFTDAVEAYDVNELVGEIGEAVARRQLRAEMGPGQKLVSNLEVVKPVLDSRANTINEWKLEQQRKGTMKPAEIDKAVAKLREGDGYLWWSVTEVDNMIVDVMPDGRLRPVMLEQTKSGKKDSPDAAKKQNNDALDAMQKIEEDGEHILSFALFDRVGKNKLGDEVTRQYDLADLKTAREKSRTRGLPGKDFDQTLAMGPTRIRAEDMREVLEGIARDLVGENAARRWNAQLAASGGKK